MPPWWCGAEQRLRAEQRLDSGCTCGRRPLFNTEAARAESFCAASSNPSLTQDCEEGLGGLNPWREGSDSLLPCVGDRGAPARVAGDPALGAGGSSVPAGRAGSLGAKK